MSQTAYGLLQTPLPGVLYDGASADDVMSFINVDSTWNMPFGVGVVRHSTDEQGAKMPASTSDEFLGAVILDHTHDPGPNGTLVQSGTVGTSPGPGLTNGAALGVLRKGRMWVLVETDGAGVVVGSQAYMRCTQNGAGKLQLGAFRGDSDSGNGFAVQARFISGAKVVPATTPYPGQSAGSGQSAVNVAAIEITVRE